MATKDDIFSSALTLAPRDRAELVAKLLASLTLDETADAATQAEIDEAWDVELERRVLEFRDGGVQAIPWDEVERNLDERRRRRLARRG